MQAGKLRHQITIKQPPANTSGVYGLSPQAVSTFTPFATVFASIEPLSAREMEFARNFAATASHKVTIRYLAGVLPTFIIQFGTRLFSISGPALNFEERNIYLTLYCTEQVG